MTFSEDLAAPSARTNPAFVSYGGHFYTLTPSAMSRAAAESFAQGVGGHLVSITSATEQAFVSARFGDAERWIGASDAAAEGSWTWPTGEAFS